MDYKKIKRLLSNAFRQKVEYKKQLTTFFVFVFKERHKLHYEIIDMSIYLGKDITDEEAISEYKKLLYDFNTNSKEEYSRTYVRGYRKVINTNLIKLSKCT